MSSKYYLTKKVLKKSSAGSTTLVESLIDGQTLVLKRINLHNDHQSEQVMQEATLLASLPPHPNVISIKRWFIEANSLVLVLEACDGDLSALSDMGNDQVVDIAKQLTRGLVHIHSHGIVHRDIKPRNILYSHQKKPHAELIIKIADFGIAKRLQESMAETAIGTPYYLSPEVCSGALYDYKTDMWALGCVLYELLTKGRKPFSGNSIKELIQNIMNHQPPKLNESPYLDHMMAVLLEKDPQKRPSSQQFLDFLNSTNATYESEYADLCQRIGKDRLDTFLLLAAQARDNCCDLSFESQLSTPTQEVSSSHVLASILKLRKQANCPEVDLDCILNIMRNIPRPQWQSTITKELGSDKYQSYLKNKLYSLCFELYLLEQQVFSKSS